MCEEIYFVPISKSAILSHFHNRLLCLVLKWVVLSHYTSHFLPVLTNIDYTRVNYDNLNLCFKKTSTGPHVLQTSQRKSFLFLTAMKAIPKTLLGKWRPNLPKLASFWFCSEKGISSETVYCCGFV